MKPTPSVIIDLDAKGPPLARHPVEGILFLRVFDRTHRHVVHVFRADARRLRIGRAADCELTIEAESVGRVHAHIEVHDGVYVVVDSWSRNGTFVNGVQVERRALAAGDVVAVERVEIEVVSLDGEPGEQERAFLDGLDDPSVRQVYADWLEERGRHGGAAILRERSAYPRPPDADP